MPIKTEVNENIVLLYALLNRFNQAFGEADSSELRREMVEYFKDYEGEAPDEKFYAHPSKAVTWSLLVSSAPEFKKKDIKLDKRQRFDFERGSYLKPFLLDFYFKTSFEQYYEKVFPELKEIASQFEGVFKDMNLEQLLEKVWGVSLQGNMIVIPNPFTQSSFGPRIGNDNYQVIGMWDERGIDSYIHNIIHEGSHPLAKEIIKPYEEMINSKGYLLDKVKEHPKYPRSYNLWRTCFEEHLIRAAHRGLINPRINSEYDIEKGLKFEIDNKGMVFIRQFYGVLKESKSVKEAIPVIVEKLE